ncbi:long-chain fatty acid--CoA ligase [Streptomyces sp. AJS327]|uniref:AMP-dependent synthetase/ligase n=1 Tax=Streptomyces sp. AJS327 TaxID=2545265 RepID=UPI0015DF6223|nr:long-chain fatty acid--CoA ligase [Streptomyces sp. AJS327]MBA0053872.1 long-chain fatty acid--CoA ligase [Streptomyces sp. AJS327]
MGGIGKDLTSALRASGLAEPVAVEVTEVDGVVREVRTAPLADELTRGGLADIPFDNAAHAPRSVVLRRREPLPSDRPTAAGPGGPLRTPGRPGDFGGRYAGPGTDGTWEPVSAATFAREVSALARGLIAAGLAPGDRVALMCGTRYEWAVLDFAVWAAGGQTVPLYANSTAEQAAWVLEDSGAVFLVVENPGHARVAEKALAGLGRSLRIWQIDAGALDELVQIGRDISPRVVAERRRGVTPESTATLVYTSGTTGPPKGCVLSHANLHAEAANLVRLLRPVLVGTAREAPATLLFLPLAHILGRVVMVACLLDRITLGLWPGGTPEELQPELEAFAPTFLPAVPSFFESVRDTARREAERRGRAVVFARAYRVAVRYGEAELRRLRGTGDGPSPALRLARRLYDTLVYRRIRGSLGGRARYAISGGAALDPRLHLFLLGCGILVHEGYGLTETTAAVTLTPPLAPRVGSVGHPVPGNAVRIADDSEVLVGGRVVFGSYWMDPEATRVALRDGWLATGDLGYLDDDGYLHLVGRKKDILVTSAGENVSPAALEDRLRDRPLIGHCLVVGEGRPYVAALITLDRPALEPWLAARGLPPDLPFPQLIALPELLAIVQQAVDDANEAPATGAIRRFRLLDGEFTPRNGMLTPALTLRRETVTATYQREIEALYRDD